MTRWHAVDLDASCSGRESQTSVRGTRRVSLDFVGPGWYTSYRRSIDRVFEEVAMAMLLQREQSLEYGHERCDKRDGRAEPPRAPRARSGSRGAAGAERAGRDRRLRAGTASERTGTHGSRNALGPVGGEVRDRRPTRWVRVVPADAHRPPTRCGPVRPRTRLQVRACSRTRITKQGWLLTAVAVGVFSFVVAFGVLANALAAAGTAEVPAETAVVSVGTEESLWDIAESAAPGVDPAAVVARIEALNGLTGGAVRAGTPLEVPVGS